jgi:DNA invertase Pin-like site-specific DNA recombinase
MLAPIFDVLDAISYRRFSSGRQGKGNSVARQNDLEAKYAAAHGLRIMDTYLDAGISAYDGANGDLGDLRRLLNAAQAGKFPPGTPLLIESLDRLSRRVAWRAHRLFSDLILAGLVIVTVGDEQVYSEKSLDPLK